MRRCDEARSCAGEGWADAGRCRGDAEVEVREPGSGGGEPDEFDEEVDDWFAQSLVEGEDQEPEIDGSSRRAAVGFDAEVVVCLSHRASGRCSVANMRTRLEEQLTWLEDRFQSLMDKKKKKDALT